MEREVLTREQWDQKWWEVFLLSRRKDPTADLTKLHAAVTKWMVSHHGPRPDAPSSGPGVIGLLKAGLQIRKLTQMKLKFSPGLLAASIAAAATGFGAAYNAALDAQSASGIAIAASEWINIIVGTVLPFAAIFLHKDEAPKV